ncbi:MAG: hypothetical protein HYU37_11900 [Acidobacteria bacterium]|nr:hypothetical protein [Acidobacteriota bacterium]
MRFNRHRRAFLYALATSPLAPRAAAQSAHERLIAAIQDGGKILYLRYPPPDGLPRARELGRALYALRVPLNEILTSPAAEARRIADEAFASDRVRVAPELAAGESTAERAQAVRRLLGTIPGPGMNRVLVGDRAPLEAAAERRFADSVLPEGGMAVFLPGQNPKLLGTITAERVIASAKARGAL